MKNGKIWSEDQLQAKENRKAEQDATEDLQRAELWPGVIHPSSLIVRLEQMTLLQDITRKGSRKVCPEFPTRT
jgi:hypothetical protein